MKKIIAAVLAIVLFAAGFAAGMVAQKAYYADNAMVYIEAEDELYFGTLEDDGCIRI